MSIQSVCPCFEMKWLSWLAKNLHSLSLHPIFLQPLPPVSVSYCLPTTASFTLGDRLIAAVVLLAATEQAITSDMVKEKKVNIRL